MSKVKFNSIEILESAIGEEIPKKHTKSVYKSTSKDLRTKIENSIIEAGQEINDKAKFDADAVLRDYRNNKLTAVQIADIFMQTIIDVTIQAMIQEFEMDWLQPSERLAVQGVLTALMNEAIEIALQQASGNHNNINVDDLIIDLLTKITSESADPFNGLISINEVIHGGKIVKGEGYDHLLEFTPEQMMNYKNVASLYI